VEQSITIVDTSVGPSGGCTLEDGGFVECDLKDFKRADITGMGRGGGENGGFTTVDDIARGLFPDLSPTGGGSKRVTRKKSVVVPQKYKKPMTGNVSNVLLHPNHVSYPSYLASFSTLPSEDVVRLFKEEDKWGKNPFHRLCWKGSLQHVRKAVSIMKDKNVWSEVKDVVSTGKGNLGKTGVFYALTQGRDEVVMYLVEEGVNVRVVNNKGQTPISLAVGHVGREVLGVLERREREEQGGWR